MKICNATNTTKTDISNTNATTYWMIDEHSKVDTVPTLEDELGESTQSEDSNGFVSTHWEMIGAIN